jgi:hypothetical protein
MCVTVISWFWFCIYFCCSLGLVFSFLCLLIRTHCWTQSSLLCCWTTDKHNVRLEYHELHQYFHLPMGNGHLLDLLVCITVNGGWLFLTKTVTLALSDSSPVWKQFPYMCFCYPWDFCKFYGRNADILFAFDQDLHHWLAMDVHALNARIWRMCGWRHSCMVFQWIQRSSKLCKRRKSLLKCW